MVRASDLLHRAVDKAHEDLHALISRTVSQKGRHIFYCSVFIFYDNEGIHHNYV